MKKSAVALGVIVALGAVGVGGAWFTGEKAQTEYLRQIELANKQAQALGLSDSFKVVYKNKQFDRGFFTSQVEDEVVILATSGVSKDLKKGKTYFGAPAEEAKEYYKKQVKISRLIQG